MLLNIGLIVVSWSGCKLLPCELSNICVLWCCHILTDKDYGRPTDRKNAKNDYPMPVVEVVSVAMKVAVEVVRSAYILDK